MIQVLETDIAIVGAGHAGAQVAISLREGGYEGAVTVLNAETDLPYDRPALSKGYLSGQLTLDRTLLKKAEYWEKRAIDLRCSTRVVNVDPVLRQIQFADGTQLQYQKLVWAAGGAPRHLDCAGHDLPGVHYLRSRDDADAIREELQGASKVAVVGGGYLGLEVASVVAEMGKDVVVLEGQERILARVTGEVVSEFYAREHRRRGVEIKTSAQIVGMQEREGRVAGVELASGEIVPAELVIVGIGMIPNIEPLRDAGAEGAAGGVLVDAYCRTSLEHVYAVGDCVMQLNPYAGESPVRIESIPNATGQANIVARHLLGQKLPAESVPWFWSAQFDIKLQTIGIIAGHDEYRVCGDPESGSFSVVYLRGGVVTAVDGINSTQSFIQGRKLIGRRVQRSDLAEFPHSLPELSVLAG